MKTTIPWLIAALAGSIIIAAYFIPAAQSWQDAVGQWFEILAACAFVLGGANLFLLNLQKISARQPGWGYAAVTLISFVVTLWVGLMKVGVLPKDPRDPWSGNSLDDDGAFGWLYNHAYAPLVGTIFALLSFYIASAAFRAFRMKNTEATLLLITAFIVLMGRTYAGSVLTSGVPEEYSALSIPGMTTIIMAVFNTAGQRAIMIGIALGVVATSLKVLLGINRSYLGSGDG